MNHTHAVVKSAAPAVSEYSRLNIWLLPLPVLGVTDTASGGLGVGLTVMPATLLTPRYDAVKATDVGAPTTPEVTVKEAEIAPCGMPTVGGKFAPAG
jgi:hypothetical protein